MCVSNLCYTRVMSSRRSRDTLCRFPFADGRRCAQPAHPDYDGLCFTHGTLAPRASREDNLLRELAPLANGSSSVKARNRALKALARAIDANRLSPDLAATLLRLSRLIEQTGRSADQESFATQSGPAWDQLRRLLDQD